MRFGVAIFGAIGFSLHQSSATFFQPLHFLILAIKNTPMTSHNSQSPIPAEFNVEAENGFPNSPSNDDKTPQKRVVEVVTVPVKDVGPIRRAIIIFVSWLCGSPLTWAMHWAIRVDGTYFELYRPTRVGKPCLRTSKWTEQKTKDIISTFKVGSTTLTDDEIITASMLESLLLQRSDPQLMTTRRFILY